MRVPAGVAAGHPATAEVGLRVLESGGTAADAGVAAVLAACVAETIFTGLGGGGYATYFEASTGRVTCLDFFVAAPGLDGDRKAEPMTPIAVRFGDVPLPYEIGGASVAVPGVPAGCGEIHARWGRLPWAEVVAPAVELARTGTAMPQAHAVTLPALVEAMLPGDGGPAYAPGGRLLRGGDRLHHPGLADALAIIAEEGPGTCYTGKIGASIVESVRADGGALGPLDLSAYRVAEREVTTAPLAGRTVLGRADLNRTVETLRGLPPELPGLSHPERAVVLANALDVRGPDDRLGDTTNVTAVDPAGNACVITTTLGLGSGVWLPGLGVHLNSMLGEGELYSGDLPPGERLASMMCPLVVLDPTGALHLAVGSAGASRIRSALLTTLVGILIDDLPTSDAVCAPRLHPVDDVVHVEPHYPLPDEMALTEAGYAVNRWPTRSHYFGGVSAIGTAGAAGDPRRGGTSRLLPTP
ncbi:gamma-glutamyltransferase [Catellatospora sp. IY07-71]|uniref:gamma-glutamyltransferase n=1 Tax=Catellatospora sp. IY07-71 TaxID=2728827 RepID=UPI001BB45185|nr:gamma-glutamyltransferase [Catellatospora sp. IY07-71]BCJ71254.1 gamma-glutamyltransferase [Catellatospora sp. IY07-71]